MDATIHDYYHDCLEGLPAHPLVKHAQTLGLEQDGARLWLPFFNNRYAVDSGHLINEQGQAPSDALGLVLCRYLLNHPLTPILDGPRVTFRELPGAGPLVARFTANTNKIIASAHSADVNQLTERALGLGGLPESDHSGYDLYIRFNALPNLPLWLQYNGADDLFPANSTLIFNQSAGRYLDMQSLFIVSTYLTGQLIAL